MDEVKPSVLVMMASYNGEDFIEEQIDSVLAQDQVAVTLLIQDDGSDDLTFVKCVGYRRRFDNVVLKVNDSNLGAFNNFADMLFHADDQFDYYAFCDQDDIWDLDKLSIAINSIAKKINSGSARIVNGFGIPVLYCSDLRNVSRSLENPRYELKRISPNQNKRGTPLLRNWYSGCTMVFNKDMLHFIQSQKIEVEDWFAHDHWVYSIAYYCANAIVDLDHAPIRRRITGGNASGEVRVDSVYKNAKIWSLLSPSSHVYIKRARCLEQLYGEYMNESDRALLNAFLSYDDSFKNRVYFAIKGEYEMPNMKGQLITALRLLFGRF